MTKQTQNIRILKTLRNGKALTAAQAAGRGIVRLRSRIHELRSAGVPIRSVPYTKSTGVRAVKYVLAE